MMMVRPDLVCIRRVTGLMMVRVAGLMMVSTVYDGLVCGHGRRLRGALLGVTTLEAG